MLHSDMIDLVEVKYETTNGKDWVYCYLVRRSVELYFTIAVALAIA